MKRKSGGASEVAAFQHKQGFYNQEEKRRFRCFHPHASFCFFIAASGSSYGTVYTQLLTLEEKVWKEGGKVKTQARVDPHKRRANAAEHR